MRMRFLADECFPRAIVEALRAGGHDVRYVAETNVQASDEEVAALAVNEERVVLTEDYDFGELAMRRRIPFVGVVILGCGREPLAFKMSRALAVLGDPPQDIRGQLTLIEPGRLRQRPLRFD